MNVPERPLERRKSVSLNYIRRQALLYFRQAQGERGPLELAHYLARHAARLQFLGAGIDARQRPLCRGIRLRVVHLRMYHVDAAVVRLRLAEEEPRRTRRQPVEVPLHPLEENHLHSPRPVFHDNAQVLDIYEVAGHHGTLHLHIGEVRGNGYYGGDAPTVHITEGIEMDEVLERLHSKLALYQGSALGSHSREVLYVAPEFAHGCIIIRAGAFPCSRSSFIRFIASALRPKNMR